MARPDRNQLFHLPITNFRPEEMRVLFEPALVSSQQAQVLHPDRFLVQSRRSVKDDWVTQKSWDCLEDAIVDVVFWYSWGGRLSERSPLVIQWQPDLELLQAALHFLDPTNPAPLQGEWALPLFKPEVVQALVRMVASHREHSLLSQVFPRRVSLNEHEVEGDKVQVEMYTLFPNSTWQAGVDTGAYVYVSMLVPESLIEPLAIEALTQHYRKHQVDHVAVGVYNLSEEPYESDEAEAEED